MTKKRKIVIPEGTKFAPDNPEREARLAAELVKLPKVDNREIDVLIAEHVMDWQWIDIPYWCSDCDGLKRDGQVLAPPKWDTGPYDYEYGYSSLKFVYPLYSSSITAAWEVVEKLHGYGLRIETGYDGKNRYRVFSYYNDSKISVRAETAPMAICLAALKAQGIKYS